MRKTLGLALGSGGARGIAHIGFLQALEEAGIRPDYVTGCSMGAIVGACYCAGLPLETLREVALSLKLSKIATLNINPIRANGLLRFNKARQLLEEYLGDITFADLKIPFSCIAVDLAAGKVVELKEGNVIDAILASSSIPGAFTPAVIGDKTLVDGGILEIPSFAASTSWIPASRRGRSARAPAISTCGWSPSSARWISTSSKTSISRSTRAMSSG